MAERPIHRQFFGDAERELQLPAELIIELERTTGAGIGALCNRLFNRDFRFQDIAETIRLALIGGGESPANAAALIAAYVHPRPILESYALAVAILETAMFGRVTTADGDVPDLKEGEAGR